MATYHSCGALQLRNFYSIDIEDEDGTWVVYFNSKIHVNKRTQIGPSYSKEFTHREILSDIARLIPSRWPDVFHCTHCGR